MFCKECEKYVSFKDMEKGCCHVLTPAFVTTPDMPCVFVREETLQCGDCAKYLCKEECMEKAHTDEICRYFKPLLEEKISNLLFQLLRKGLYSRENIEILCDEFEQSPIYRFIQQQEQKEGKR